MSSISQIRNSVNSVLGDFAKGYIGFSDAQDAIDSIFLVEEWTHKSGEQLRVEDLTDREFRIIGRWLIKERNRTVYRNSPFRLMRELREMFPGLSLLAAKYLVIGK